MRTLARLETIFRVLLIKWLHIDLTSRKGVRLAAIVSAALIMFSLAGAANARAARSWVQLNLTPPAQGEYWYGKAENGVVIAWVRDTTQTGKDQIEVFNLTGNKREGLRPLDAVRGAQRCAVYDVSFGPSGLAAVAAVFVDASARISSSLLIYGRNGKLERAESLSADQDIARLEVDANDDIWTLGMGSGRTTPSSVPLVREFSPEGKQLRALSTRGLLRRARAFFQQDWSSGGNLAFGVSGRQVWMWVPGDKEFVRMTANGTGVRITPAALPPSPRSTGGVMLQAFATSGGQVIAQIGYPGRTFSSGLYLWNQPAQAWHRAAHPDMNALQVHLLGICSGHLVLAKINRTRSVWKIETAPIP